MMRTPKRSSSLFTSGSTASMTRRDWACDGFKPARSDISSIGTSPATVGSAGAPMSIWPERMTRNSSGPVSARSGQLASVTAIRPPLFCGMPSRSIGMSTLVYCGIDGESCVTMVMLTVGPGGKLCAAVKSIPAARTNVTAKALETVMFVLLMRSRSAARRPRIMDAIAMPAMASVVRLRAIWPDRSHR